MMPLPELGDGEHIITIKVIGNANNYAVRELCFIVDTRPTTTGEPMDAWPPIALAAAAGVIALGAFLIVRRRKS